MKDSSQLQSGNTNNSSLMDEGVDNCEDTQHHDLCTPSNKNINGAQQSMPSVEVPEDERKGNGCLEESIISNEDQVKWATNSRSLRPRKRRTIDVNSTSTKKQVALPKPPQVKPERGIKRTVVLALRAPEPKTNSRSLKPVIKQRTYSEENFGSQAKKLRSNDKEKIKGSEDLVTQHQSSSRVDVNKEKTYSKKNFGSQGKEPESNDKGKLNASEDVATLHKSSSGDVNKKKVYSKKNFGSQAKELESSDKGKSKSTEEVATQHKSSSAVDVNKEKTYSKKNSGSQAKEHNSKDKRKSKASEDVATQHKSLSGVDVNKDSDKGKSKADEDVATQHKSSSAVDVNQDRTYSEKHFGFQAKEPETIDKGKSKDVANQHKSSSGVDVNKDKTCSEKHTDFQAKEPESIDKGKSKASEDVATQHQSSSSIDVNKESIPYRLRLKKDVIPVCHYAWRGKFETHNKEGITRDYYWFQAHASNVANPKVVKMAVKFPERIILDELPRSEIWPSRFMGPGNEVTEEDIALYFYAGDNDSYDTYYSELMNHMTKNDLALRGNIDDVADLLIFPSNILPDGTQEWNSMLFFWCVFIQREVKTSADAPAPSSSKPIRTFDLNDYPEDENDMGGGVSEIAPSSSSVHAMDTL